MARVPAGRPCPPRGEPGAGPGAARREAPRTPRRCTVPNPAKRS